MLAGLTGAPAMACHNEIGGGHYGLPCSVDSTAELPRYAPDYGSNGYSFSREVDSWYLPREPEPDHLYRGARVAEKLKALAKCGG